MKYRSLTVAGLIALLATLLFFVMVFAQARTGAVCQDGTTSSATGRGACSHHGGVAHWIVSEPEATPTFTDVPAIAPTFTAVPTLTPTTPVKKAPALNNAQPSPTITMTPVPDGVITRATVLKAANLRAGPGTTYAVVGTAKAGQAVTIAGKNPTGTWYHLDKGQWIATFLVKVTNAGATTTPSTALPTETPNQSNLPDTQGCYLFQNQLGAELNVTITRTDTNQGMSFKIASGQETTSCFEPSQYTYTVDAPPPRASINGQLDVKAGDRILFPVRAR